MKHLIIEIIGWLGMILIIAAYALVSFSVIELKLLYQVLSGFGGVGIIIVSFYKRAYQLAVLNVIWVLIVLLATLRILG